MKLINYFLKFNLKIALFILLSIGFLNAYTLNPQTDVDFQVDEYFFELIDQAKDGEFLKALETSRKIVDLIPEHPAGHLFASAVLSWIIDTFYNFDYGNQFLEEAYQTIRLSKDMIYEHRLDPWGYVYLGGAYGFRGIYYSLIGNFFSAFTDGVRGNYQLLKAIELDPNIYDNYFGTGTFDFWKAYYTGKFFWLGGGDKNKQKGIDKVLLAIEKGKYTVLEANFSLVRIYLADENYQAAIDKGFEMLEKSPKSIKVRRFLGKAQMGLTNYQGALETFTAMEKLLEEHPLTTPAALLDVNMDIAKSMIGMGNREEAKQLIEESKELVSQIKEENDFLESLLLQYEDLSESLFE